MWCNGAWQKVFDFHCIFSKVCVVYTLHANLEKWAIFWHYKYSTSAHADSFLHSLDVFIVFKLIILQRIQKIAASFKTPKTNIFLGRTVHENAFRDLSIASTVGWLGRVQAMILINFKLARTLAKKNSNKKQYSVIPKIRKYVHFQQCYLLKLVHSKPRCHFTSPCEIIINKQYIHR